RRHTCDQMAVLYFRGVVSRRQHNRLSNVYSQTSRIVHGGRCHPGVSLRAMNSVACATKMLESAVDRYKTEGPRELAPADLKLDPVRNGEAKPEVIITRFATAGGAA